MTRVVPTHTTPVGEVARKAVVVTTLGSWAVAIGLAAVAVFKAFDPPYWAFGLPSLVPLAALVVLWPPARRTENAWLHLFFGALLLGLFGAAWGAYWALLVSAVTLGGMLLAPRSSSSRKRRR